MAKRELFKIIKEYITYIRTKGYNVTDAFLFGSYAKNKANAESDIDISVILNEVDNYFDTQVELMKLRRNISIYIEPHPISQKDFKEHPLFYVINKYGLKVI